VTRALVTVVVLALVGCGEPRSTTGRAQQAIVGGTPTTGDLNVYLLEIVGDNGAGSSCSATLIAPRTLLTAAHCVDPVMLGAGSVRIVASNVPDRALMQPNNTVRVTETRYHPKWMPAIGLEGDVALALLETPQPVTPKPWNQGSLEGLSGAAVRAVGYGTIGNGQGGGTKRTVDLIIRQLTDELISLGNQVDKGICHGDSGGPTFGSFDGGVEQVIGVHSFTRTQDCVDGADTRVDAYAPFIMQWLAERENECATNAVCAVGPCPTPDVDCVAFGSACTTEYQCPGRRCADDPQHPARYCTRPCGSTSDCPAGFECALGRGVCTFPQLPEVRVGEPCIPGQTHCLRDSVCAGDPQPLCSQRCEITGDCPAPLTCKPAASGEKLCTLPPPVVLPRARLEQPAAPGCSTGGGLGSLVLALALARRARRVRNC
jgi:V8-like Glu-specific endopeptidase